MYVAVAVILSNRFDSDVSLASESAAQRLKPLGAQRSNSGWLASAATSSRRAKDRASPHKGMHVGVKGRITRCRSDGTPEGTRGLENLWGYRREAAQAKCNMREGVGQKGDDVAVA